MLETDWLPQVVVQATDRVERRLDERWTLERMADEARFSPFHFHRLFRDAAGETPRAWLERVRLERAALLLLADTVPITELAWQVGFQNPETLSRRFKAHFGISARAYRRDQLRNWEALGLEAGCDPVAGSGRIELRRLEPGPLQVRRRCGDPPPFDFGCSVSWGDEPATERWGLGLDWPGLTPPERLRQDWGRPLSGALLPGFVRRDDVAGLYATLEVDDDGPIANEVYQRLFVWALGGRFRLRPGPIVERGRGGRVLVGQPVTDTEEDCDVRVRDRDRQAAR